MDSKTANKTQFAFRANSDETINLMLESLGLKSLDELFNDIPSDLLVKSRPSRDFPEPHSELETYQHMIAILSKNKTSSEYLSFLGSGVWDHFVPSAVEEIVNRTEFKTSYTPYAPEMSQGILTALYEYQSMITELTGLRAANTSLYDWATALGEAALMCARVKITKNPQKAPTNPIFLTSEAILPDRYETLLTYTEPLNITVKKISVDPQNGLLDLDSLKKNLSNDVVGIYVESPNVFGLIEENLKEISEMIHSIDALAVVGVDLISLGVLEAPGVLGADICVGEGQPLGMPMNFGGPLLGIFTTTDEKEMLRNLPGRIIGYTRTKDDSKDAYIMTLQTREQHIRREKATSNLCTNEALFSLATATYLSLIGPNGLKELGNNLLGRIGYVLNKLTSLPTGFTIPYRNNPHFKEFLLTLPKGEYSKFKEYMLKHEILIGQNIGNSTSILLNKDAIIISVSEKHSMNDLNKLIDAIKAYKS